MGDDPASQVYVRNKRRACEQVGFYSEGFELPADTTQETLEALVDRLNEDDRIHGILVQLPLPRHLDAGRWQSWQKLKNENSYAADSESYLAAKEKKFKEISKINKYNKKR